MSNEPIGIVAEQQARREQYARFVDRPAYVWPKETRITVDCRTGQRTIERVTPTVLPRRLNQPKPPPVFRALSGYSPEFRRVASAVCRAFEIDPLDLLAPGKSMRVAAARRALFRLMWHLHHWSYVRLAKTTGRDQTGVRKALLRATKLYQGSNDWRSRYDAALHELGAQP